MSKFFKQATLVTILLLVVILLTPVLSFFGQLATVQVAMALGVI